MNKIDLELQKILFNVLKKKFKKLTDLKVYSIKEWDSLANFNILLEVEKKFKIKFSFDEITEINSIKSIKKVIKKNFKK
jgi:acyl carrier protein|tara:strand:+ start:544 stop:780 length:237 start_codon:yes stop_codon:yes gene_type:complete